MALYRRGVALADRGQVIDAIVVYDRIIDNFDFSDEPVVVGTALFAKAGALASVPEFERSLDTYNALLRRLENAEGSALIELKAKTLFNKGAALHLCKRLAEADVTFEEVEKHFGESHDPILSKLAVGARFTRRLISYDQIIARLDEADEPTLQAREDAAEALLNKGLTFGETGRDNGIAAAIYDAVVERFGKDVELPLRVRVAKALFNKALAMHELGRDEDAIADLDELLFRCCNASELPLQEQAARAFYNKGTVVSSGEEAIKVFGELVARYGTSNEPTLRQQVVRALVGKGVHLAKLGMPDEAITAFDEVRARLGEVAELTQLERMSLAAASREKARLERQISDLVAEQNVQDSPVPGEPTTPAGEPGSPRPRSALPVLQTSHELTRPDLSAAAAAILAQPRAQSVVALLERDPDALIRAADEILRKPEQTHQTTGRPQPGPSRKSKLAEAAKLVTGELPPLLARKRVRRKPGKPSLNAEAQRIVSQFQRDHEKVEYDERAREIVKAARVILTQNRGKNQPSRGKPARQSVEGTFRISQS
jgi:tetratricopeptide (TPR) repeat protein